MCGITIATTIARIAIRFMTRRRLFLDDYFLIFAAICIIVATSMLWWWGEGLYLYWAISLKPQIGIEQGELSKLLDGNMIMSVYVPFVWTATYSIKLSFLSLFKVLIRNVSSHLTRYFWFVVALTIVSWAFSVIERFLLCHYYGVDTVKCWNPSSALYTSLTTLVNLLDIITDILVVTFPIKILSKSQMDRGQKFGLGAFLCLSIVMILITLVRVLGAIRKGESQLDVTWEIFWQSMEGCAAIIAASATVFRTVFLRSKHASEERRRYPEDKQESVESGSESTEPPRLPPPTMLRSTLGDVRSFIERSAREDRERL
ncbi:hypothetical protein BC567DRAFT_221263 [Phyllosticta citribraziliensis]